MVHIDKMTIVLYFDGINPVWYATEEGNKWLCDYIAKKLKDRKESDA